MIRNELISFIVGARRTGAEDKLIIKGLLDVGWQKGDIFETLTFLGKNKKTNVYEKEEISLILIAIVVIFLFGAELCARVLGFSFLALLF